jgi:hypothetical protein
VLVCGGRIPSNAFSRTGAASDGGSELFGFNQDVHESALAIERDAGPPLFDAISKTETVLLKNRKPAKQA